MSEVVRPHAVPASVGPILTLADVSVRYRLAKQRIPSLKEYAIHLVKGTLSYGELWALRGVSMTLDRGETLGIVGSNGAGKSTLLKVVSRVLKPTRGEVVTRGFVAPILELGTGFDHELTGFENIYLNALLLGRSRREIDERVESIVDFSGIRDFIHTPIRNYSSGMIARLGFAIATAWVPDILILDEVLSVGDAGFLRRCESRLREFQDLGSSLLMVSHDVRAVLANCERVLWLEKGSIKGLGPAEEVVGRYLEFSRRG